MNRVDELLSRYIKEHRAGDEPDPLPYLDELTGTERIELAALIDGFLAEAPPPPFDQERFDRFREDPAHAELVDRLLAPSLQELRTEAELSKQAVTKLLSEELGLAGHEPAVKGRYHEL